MENFPYISNENFNFVPVLEFPISAPSKNCPICLEVLGIIGLIHSTRRVCQFCKRVICKKCSPRKITSQKLRVCKECYNESLKNYYMKTISDKLASDIEDEDLVIEGKEKILKVCEDRHRSSLQRLEILKQEFKAVRDEYKVKLIPLLDLLKESKEKCVAVREKLKPYEIQLAKLDLTANELNSQIEKTNDLVISKHTALQELRETLSILQDHGSQLLSTIQTRLTKAGAHDLIHEEEVINSVKDLKALASKKLKENQELIQESSRLENEIHELDKEIKAYESRKSCRFSGSFSQISLDNEKDSIEAIPKLEKEYSLEDLRVEDLRRRYEQKRMSMKINEERDESACFECNLW